MTPPTEACPGLDHPAYLHATRLRGYSRPVCALNASDPSAACRVLRSTMPSLSREDHLRIALQHAHQALEHTAAWASRVDNACLRHFGRRFAITDYRISAIAREEFGEDDKQALRLHARSGSDHTQLAIVHRMLAGCRHGTALAWWRTLRDSTLAVRASPSH